MGVAGLDTYARRRSRISRSPGDDTRPAGSALWRRLMPVRVVEEAVLSALELARLQFALTAGFHFLFVALTLGLAPLVAIMQTRHVFGGKPVHGQMTRFWGQLYLINYGLGIITGLVMEFQFGLNWNGLTRFAGNVFGAPLALETLTAFFLESTFLGMWIFGWGRLPRYLHLALIWLVTLTAYLSAFWIMVANGFQQHPVGGRVVDGEFQLSDFGELITNPEAIDGMVHLVFAALLVGSLFVAGISAWHFARRTADAEFFRSSLWMGLVVAAVFGPLTINGSAQLDYLVVDQPSKAAAFGVLSPAAAQAALTARFGPGNYLSPSWLDIPATIMRFSGFLFGGLSVIVLILMLASRGRVTGWRWVMRPLSWVIPLPFVIVLVGWLVREEGRQPWMVYGLLRTDESVSPVQLTGVITSFIVFVGIFTILAALNYGLIVHFARRGPAAGGLLGMPGAAARAGIVDGGAAESAAALF